METKYSNGVASITWVLTAVTAGVLQHVDTLSGWGMLAALAIGPAYLLFQWQLGPRQPLPHTIRKDVE